MQPQHVVDKVSDDTVTALDGRPNDYGHRNTLTDASYSASCNVVQWWWEINKLREKSQPIHKTTPLPCRAMEKHPRAYKATRVPPKNK